MYQSTSRKAEEFISHEEILSTLSLAEQEKNNHTKIKEILKKAKEKKGLHYKDAAILLACTQPDLEEELFALAREIKEEFYGKRIVMFAPLYLSNYCVNQCVYCPYQHSNKTIKRKKLTQDEIRQEVMALEDMGHKRLALETGEDPIHSDLDYLLESIETIYGIKHKNGEIRRVNVNIAATTVDNYRRLKEAEIGTYILFQETYHKETYQTLHPKGPKSNYAYHTEAMDRAMEAGIEDVGVGVLFGLNLYPYDLVGLLMHAQHLEDTFGVGPHTISVPRICPGDQVDQDDFNGISDDIFKKIVAILRISAPYAGIILSTRESKEVREAVLPLGVSQISGASSTSVGGYSLGEKEETAQFELRDERTLDEIVDWLLDLGYIPSFCTACYKEGRTGDRFMHLVKTGQISNICQANSIMTLKEYLEDYATPEVAEKGCSVLTKELEKIPNPKVKEIVKDNLKELDEGKRSFRF